MDETFTHHKAVQEKDISFEKDSLFLLITQFITEFFENVKMKGYVSMIYEVSFKSNVQ